MPEVSRDDWRSVSASERDRLEKKKRDGEQLSDEERARLAGQINTELPERLKIKLERDRENRMRMQERGEYGLPGSGDGDLTVDELAKLEHAIKNKQPLSSDLGARIMKILGIASDDSNGAREEDKISRVGRGRAGLDKVENRGPSVIKPRSEEEKAAEELKKENEAAAARIAAGQPADFDNNPPDGKVDVKPAQPQFPSPQAKKWESPTPPQSQPDKKK